MLARMTGTQWNDLSAIVGRTIFVAVQWFCSADSVEVPRLVQPDVSTRVAAHALMAAMFDPLLSKVIFSETPCKSMVHSKTTRAAA